MLETLFYLILILISIYILGYGITSILLPEKLKPSILFLIPWTFFIVTILLSVLASLLGFSASQSAPAISVVFLFITGYIYFKKKPKMICTKRDLIVFAVIFLSVIFNIIPILRREGILTTITFGNNDIIAYVTAADFLVEHSLSESFYSNVVLSVENLFHDGYRWGPSTITAFFLSLFNLTGYQLGYLIQAILFGFTIPLIYVLLRVLYKDSFWGMILAFAMLSLNVNLLYMLYHNFFGLVMFWGIELMLFILFFAYYGTGEEHKRIVNKFDLLIALSISALYFSYHEPAIFLLAPLVFYFLWRVITRNNVFILTQKLITVGLIVLSIASLSVFNAIIFDFGQAFAGNTDAPIGWQLFRPRMPYANPFEALGFYSIHSFPPLPNVIAIVLSILVLSIITLGIIKSRQKAFLLFFTFVILFFYYWTAIKHNNFFDYNRVVTYTLPFFIVLFVIGIVHIFKRKYSKILVVMILSGLVMFSALKLNKRLRVSYSAVDKSLVSLQNVPMEEISEPVYTEGFVDPKVPYWVQNWTGYFIYHNDVAKIPTEFNDKSSPNKVPENSLVLNGKYSRWYSPPKKVLNDIIWENEYYKIGRICYSDECLKRVEDDNFKLIIGNNNWEDALLLSGWSQREGNMRWSNSKRATLRLTKKEAASKLHIEARTLNEPQTMTVFINGQQMKQISLSNEWRIYSVPVDNTTEGIYKIKLQFSNLYNPSELNINADKRSLSAAFKSFILK